MLMNRRHAAIHSNVDCEKIMGEVIFAVGFADGILANL